MKKYISWGIMLNSSQPSNVQTKTTPLPNTYTVYRKKKWDGGYNILFPSQKFCDQTQSFLGEQIRFNNLTININIIPSDLNPEKSL